MVFTTGLSHKPHGWRKVARYIYAEAPQLLIYAEAPSVIRQMVLVGPEYWLV
jgi:hypothetical protein